MISLGITQLHGQELFRRTQSTPTEVMMHYKVTAWQH